MKGIGGNTTAKVQVCTATRNEIGEQVQTWVDAQTIKGWLDMQSGDARYTTYNAKIQESTHVFICDFVTLAPWITAESARMSIGGKKYDILLIDDPMELHQQLEFFLKFTGGQ